LPLQHGLHHYSRFGVLFHDANQLLIHLDKRGRQGLIKTRYRLALASPSQSSILALSI
jgi:hypothetical protein